MRMSQPWPAYAAVDGDSEASCESYGKASPERPRLLVPSTRPRCLAELLSLLL